MYVNNPDISGSNLFTKGYCPTIVRKYSGVLVNPLMQRRTPIRCESFRKQLSKGMGDEEFHAMVQPALASLFAVNDRGVRVMLLSSIPLYAKRLEDRVVNEQVSWSCRFQAAFDTHSYLLKMLDLFPRKVTDDGRGLSIHSAACCFEIASGYERAATQSGCNTEKRDPNPRSRQPFTCPFCHVHARRWHRYVSK